MSPAKIRLSATERELLCNYEWILTKNAILQKTGALLIHLQPELEKIIAAFAAHIPAAALATRPKLSRGDNYRGLPYLVLDYPRLFTKTDVFAMRTIFWWGHFFSVTLQLGGAPAHAALPALIQSRETAANAALSVGIGDNEWEHHFEDSNYRAAADLSTGEWASILKEKHFIKLARTLPIGQWEQSPEFIADSYRVMLGLLQQPG